MPFKFILILSLVQSIKYACFNQSINLLIIFLIVTA